MNLTLNIILSYHQKLERDNSKRINLGTILLQQNITEKILF